MKITKRQLRRLVREASGSTKKYDDDSALRGNQSKLPDALQKGIIDKTVEDREEQEAQEKEKKNESITSLLRSMIKEVITAEGECDKASGHAGCIRKRSKGWVVLSNKDGKCWGRQDDEGECTYYSSKKEAQKALGAYHR